MIEVPVEGGDPVTPSKIVAIGRNYIAHAAEMKAEPATEPMFFLKPTTCLVPGGGEILLTSHSEQVQHEIELAVVIGEKMTHIHEEQAMDHVMGYAAFIDVTARDLQGEAKTRGHPWSRSKGYDTFGPISSIIRKDQARLPTSLHLSVNGEVRQEGSTSDMIFPLPRLLSFLSSCMTLLPGDIIATGTPSGVGSLRDGDRVIGTVEGIGILECTVRRP